MSSRLARRGLYAITPERSLRGEALIAAVTAALDGGAVMVQYRAKRGASAAEALALHHACQARGVPLIVNDDPVLALDVGAAGVHLGRDDAAIAAARALLGERAIIGASCYDDLGRATEAVRAGADYVAFGRFYPSATKPQAVPAPPALLTEARRQLAVPIVAIGGITPDNGAALITAGADLLAVVDGVFGAVDPRQAAARYQSLFTIAGTTEGN
jgi:thiamine-phosphate pyrophosphorylase